MRIFFLFFLLSSGFIEGRRSIATDREALKRLLADSYCFCIIIWPCAHHLLGSIDTVLDGYGRVLYRKDFVMPESAQLFFMRKVVYAGEFLGSSVGYMSAKHKRASCFPYAQADKNIVTCYVYKSSGRKQVVHAKHRVRRLCGMGFHAMHSSDNYEQKERIGRVVFGWREKGKKEMLWW